MPALYFHDLPIYRLTHDKYEQELRELTPKVIYDPPGTLLPTTEESKVRARARLLAHYHRHLGKWRFNEVVGYVRLSVVSRHVQGAYFGRRGRDTGPRHDKPIAREVRTRTKVFVSELQLAGPLPFPRDATNAQCLAIVVDYVSACQKALPRRYFDDEWLKTTGPHVDWRGIADASDAD